MEINSTLFVNSMYDELEKLQLKKPDNFNQHIVDFHTKDFVEKILEQPISDELYQLIYGDVKRLWLEKFGDKKMWAYCCGTLIFKPDFHGDDHNVLRCFELEEYLMEGRMRDYDNRTGCVQTSDGHRED